MHVIQKQLKKNTLIQLQILQYYLSKNLKNFKGFFFLTFIRFSNKIFLILNLLQKLQVLQAKHRNMCYFLKVLIINKERFGYWRGKKLARRKRYLQRQQYKIYF